MAKPKKEDAVQFVLTAPVWRGSEQLPVGSVLTFENDEPTGVYKGRCKPAGAVVAAPAAADTSAFEARIAELEAELAKRPPAPPGA